jgi:hypothetical protein
MPDSASTWLAAFGLRLKGGGFEIEADDGALTVTGPDGGRSTVTCAPRAADDNRLWFFADSEPLADVDQVTWALTALQTHLLDRSVRSGRSWE